MFKFLSSKKIQIVTIAVLTALAYSNIFGNEFVIDDRTFIVDWQTKNSFDMVGFFRGDLPPGHEGVYRPIRSVFYAFYYSIFGQSPLGYHLHSILVHLASTALVYFIVVRISADRWRISTDRKVGEGKGKEARNDMGVGVGVAARMVSHSTLNQNETGSDQPKRQPKLNGRPNLNPNTNFLPFVAALLFGLHPVHTETITYIASSMEATGIVFAFLSFYLYLLGKKYYWWSVGFAVAAFFTNEVTLVLPLLIVLYEWTLGSAGGGLGKLFRLGPNFPFSLRARGPGPEAIFHFPFTKFLPYFAAAGVYLSIRFLILDIGARGPYLADSIWLTFLTMVKVFIKYLTLLIMPVNLANNHVISPGIEAFVYRDYRQEAIKAQSLLDGDILIYLMILSVLVFSAFILRKKYPIFTFCVFWFFISLLAVSEIVPQGSILNEKSLYLASFGFVLIAGFLTNEFFKKGFEYIALAVLILISGFYLSMTFVRNRDWKDDVTIWSADVRLYPQDNAYAYFQLGNAYAARAIVEPAIENYQKSYQINPGFVVALGAIGKVYNDIGRVDLAIDFYKKSLEMNPYFWEGYLNLANIYFRRGDFDLARSEYEKLLKIAPGFVQVEENLKNLPEIREATRAGKADENVWLKYHKVGGLSMTVPSVWRIRPGFNRLTLTDEKEEFEANFVISTRDPKESFEDYLKRQTETYGKLVNEGLALIPNFERAYVKVWSMPSTPEVTGQSTSGVATDGKDVTKLQFFLFGEDKVIEIVVSPGSSPQMQNFDIVLGSIKISKLAISN